jgi:PDZ domain
VTAVYDERGNIVEMAYFGVDGKPALDKDGKARVTYRYDERGNGVEIAFFGADGKPTLDKDGYARWTAVYDERGNQVETAYFGVDGKPISDAGRGATSLVEKDAKGRIVSKIVHDAEGHAVPIDGIGKKAQYSYADGDQPISVIYLDERNKVIPVEVEVKDIIADSTAAKVGLQLGDRLLSYAGQKMNSVQQLIALVGKPGADARKLVYRRGQNTVTVEVSPGRLGVEIANVRAAPSAAVPPKRR